MVTHMKAQTGMAKPSLQFRWLDAPRSNGTARAGQAVGFESSVVAAKKADALDHASERVDEALQQVLKRAILAEQKASILEASLKDMTAQRDKWVLQADDWKEQAQRR